MNSIVLLQFTSIINFSHIFYKRNAAEIVYDILCALYICILCSLVFANTLLIYVELYVATSYGTATLHF